MILGRQKTEGWGARVIDRLSRDLQNAFPGQQGFSLRNLKSMRAFAAAWPETTFVQRPVAQLAGLPAAIMHRAGAQTDQAAIVQQPVAQLANHEGSLRLRFSGPPCGSRRARPGIVPSLTDPLDIR
jgi:hypothetical protein